MKKVQRKWDLISKEKRKASIEDIIRFFKDQGDDEIDIIRAGGILDFFLEFVGEDIYNRGIEDSKIMVRERFQDLEVT